MSDAWKVGKDGKKGIRKTEEYCVLVGIISKDEDETHVMEYLDELEFLATTAGAVTQKVFTQKMPHPNVKTFVGSGKLEEIRMYIEANEDITLAIFDEDLTGKQNSFLEEYLKVKIVDRSTLILDIFADRAQTAQAKTQVELAQMQYILPRLRGLWTHLERQRGGIGMRGPGGVENRTGRRVIRAKNAFLTLDTTVRKVVWDSMPFLLSDTVGFIRKLPHHLVESFKSTLDEVRESDILVHVVDISHPQHDDHILTVQNTLNDLGASDRTTLMVFNKVDLYREKYFDDFLDSDTKAEIMQEIRDKFSNTYNFPNVLISATNKENIDELREVLKEMIIREYEVRYPFQTKSW